MKVRKQVLVVGFPRLSITDERKRAEYKARWLKRILNDYRIEYPLGDDQIYILDVNQVERVWATFERRFCWETPTDREYHAWYQETTKSNLEEKTLRAVTKAWLEVKYRAKHQRDQRNKLSKQLKVWAAVLEPKPLSHFEIGDLADALDRIVEERGLRGGTIKTYRRTLARCWEFAVNQGWATHNPAEDLPQHDAEFELAEKRALDIGELRLIQNALIGYRADKGANIWEASEQFRTWCFILMYTSVRASEALEIRWCDVMRGDEFTLIKVRVRKTEKRGQRNWHTVYMQNWANQMLKAYMALHGGRWTYLFPGRETSRPTSYGAMYERWKVLVHSIGLDDITPHIFRHTATTRLLEAGADPGTISDQLSHRDKRTIERYDKREETRQDPETSRLLSEFLGGPGTSD